MKIEHYGKLLKAEITDKGYSKKKIASVLAISYNTLIQRLKDGEFSQSQLKKLVEKRYI